LNDDANESEFYERDFESHEAFLRRKHRRQQQLLAPSTLGRSRETDDAFLRSLGISRDARFDLPVVEMLVEQIPEPPEFRVGDRVIVVSCFYRDRNKRPRRAGTVAEITRFGYRVKCAGIRTEKPQIVHVTLSNLREGRLSMEYDDAQPLTPRVKRQRAQGATRRGSRSRR
jgi:hypothetical protein